ncbi:MAG: hypothetical protein AAB354_02055 [candidate division KSB1 bacterium]
MNTIVTKLTRTLAALLLLALVACSKNPSAPNTSDNNEARALAGATGAEIFRSVQTLEQLQQAGAGPEAFGKITLPAVGSLTKSSSLFAQRTQPLHLHAAELARRAQSLSKTNGDSLVYENRWTDPATGISYHARITYDSATGLAVVTVVAYDFPATNILVRDSARVLVHTNFTLADTTDDVVQRLAVRKDYRSAYRLRYEEGTLVPDAYQPGTEPNGGVVDARKRFNAGQDTLEANYHLEYHRSTGGNLSEALLFENGERASTNITFTERSFVFRANFRDGASELTQVTKTGAHAFAFDKTLTFAPGADPVSLREEGKFAFNPSDSSASTDFVRETLRSNGSKERCELHATESRQNGFRRLTISASSSNGTSFNYILQESANRKRVEGNAINEEGQYILFNADFYANGSADLHLAVYASKAAFERGEKPIFTADLHYRPDGSGNGRISSAEGMKAFTFGSEG